MKERKYIYKKEYSENTKGAFENLKYSSRKFLKIIIYLFFVVLGLYCYSRVFSSCGAWGLLFRCVGLSLRWLLLLQSTGSRTQDQ